VVFFHSGFPNENDKTKQYTAILAAVGRQVTEVEQALQVRDLFLDR
jgi:hypothetical protein